MHKTLLTLTTCALLATAVGAAPALAAYPIQQYLQVRSASNGTYTPDGKGIVFSSNITGVPQLWKVPREGGWPEQYTFHDDAVRHAQRSPRGDWLLFSKDTGGDERQQLYLLSPDGTRQVALTNDPKVIHTFGGWSADGTQITYASNGRNQAFFDVYVMDVKTRKSRRVLTHDGTNYAVGFAPDGKSLVYTRVDTPSNANLYLLSLQSGKSRLLTPHKGNANYEYVEFGRDGKLYFASDEGREFNSLASLNPKGGRLTFLSPDNADVEGVQFNDARSQLAYLTNNQGYSQLWLRPIGQAASKRLPNVPEGVMSDLTWAPDGKELAVTFSGPKNAYDVWRYDLAASRFKQVTKSTLAGLPASSFVAPTLITYPSFDGRKIPAFWYLPKGAKKDAKLPTIVFVHGGPESQERPDFAASFQYYLNRGYAMLALNIRGSIGYGKTYTHLDDVRRRKDAIRDVEFATRWLKSGGYADPGKLVVMGGSYGGYMTLACLTMQPEIWAAGVDTVGMSNLVSFLENTGPWRRPLREAEYGALAADMAFLKEVSPINHVQHIKAPLMVIQGANDPRVPKTEADQIVASLKARNLPVEYLLFADEGHGVVKLPNRIKTFTATAAFLDKYVKNK